jgi:predicted nucleotidyltransferase component of viral defense system
MRNQSASIRARLLNLAKEQGLSFQYIIIRYLQERFLYRLSISPYQKNFYLKGGALMYAIVGSSTRFTLDIDFLGKEIANNATTIEVAFGAISSIPCISDGVVFDPDSIQAEIITEQDKYHGIRVFVIATFHTVKQRLQMDIGFGDIMVPTLQDTLEYPVLLSESEVPMLLVYSSETLIAEKFQAMIELSLANSRMKDFYDVYKLLLVGRHSDSRLKESIKATFNNRNTPYTQNHSLFSEEFYTDPSRIRMWKTFLKKIGKDKELVFEEVGKVISTTLHPIWEGLKA